MFEILEAMRRGEDIGPLIRALTDAEVDRLVVDAKAAIASRTPLQRAGLWLGRTLCGIRGHDVTFASQTRRPGVSNVVCGRCGHTWETWIP